MAARSVTPRTARALLVLLQSLLISLGCADGAEGESCDPANGDGDCDDGLVCTPAHAVASEQPVCCPRPPSRPGVAECDPELPRNHVPDPAIDGSFAAGGTGVGGAAGGTGATGGAAGSGLGGSAGVAQDSGTDAEPDAAIPDAPPDVTPDASRAG